MEGYWEGPYGTWVPNDIHRIVAEDGGNILTKVDNLINMTEMFICKPLTEEEWKARYAVQSEDGQWFYKVPLPTKENRSLPASSFICTNTYKVEDVLALEPGTAFIYTTQ